MKTLTLLLVFSVAVGGQHRPPAKPQTKPAPSVVPCTLASKELVPVRGLYLDQAYENLEKVMPTRWKQMLKNESEEYGVKLFFLRRSNLVKPELFDGLSRIEFAYLDDKLAAFGLTYEPNVSWKSNRDFVAAVAPQLKLPTAGWQSEDPAFLKCNDFYVRVSGAPSHPEIRFAFNKLEQEVVRRAADYESKKRTNSKP